jgi:hypothetical protein
MALQSAWLLCTRLLGAEGWVDATGVPWQREVAHWYAQDWQREFEPRLQLAAAFAQLAMRPAAAAPLVALARTWPGLLTLGARWGGKVHCAAGPAAIAGAIARHQPRAVPSTALVNPPNAFASNRL